MNELAEGTGGEGVSQHDRLRSAAMGKALDDGAETTTRSLMLRLIRGGMAGAFRQIEVKLPREEATA